jgi:hypothetical protein
VWDEMLTVRSSTQVLLTTSDLTNHDEAKEAQLCEQLKLIDAIYSRAKGKTT